VKGVKKQGEKETAQNWDDSISPSPPPLKMGGVLCGGISGVVDYKPIRDVEYVLLEVLSMYQVDMLCEVGMWKC
jgi:hypothetical protein